MAPITRPSVPVRAVGLLVFVTVALVLSTATRTPGAAAQPTPGSVDALLARCPTAAEVAAVDAAVRLTFEAQPPSALVCRAADGSADLTLLQQRAYQALLVMRTLPFDEPLPWVNRHSLFDWFVEAVDGVRFRGDIAMSSCCDPSGVINVHTRDAAALMTDRWIEPRSGVGMSGLVTLLVHEARHAEGYPHTCGTNDQAATELGAWGVQYLLLRWFARHTGPTFLTTSDPSPNYYRDMAQGEAEGILRTRFCTHPPAGFGVATMMLRAEPVSHAGPCPAVVRFSGTITATGAGTVIFRFVRSDGAAAPVQRLTFDRAGTQMIETTWTLGGPGLPAYDGWQAIQVILPDGVRSGEARFSVRCT